MKDKILLLRKQGKTYKEITKILGCSKSLVSYYIDPFGKKKWMGRQHKKRLKQKQEYSLILGGKCEKCGYNKCLNALHFHHKNPSEKLFEITPAIWGKCKTTKSQIIEEVKKCMLLCANCHAEIHSENLVAGIGFEPMIFTL